MFEAWENFYLIVGPSAAALIGLLFVVATLTRGVDSDRVARSNSLYMTPVVFHFAVVMVLSAVASIASLPRGAMAVAAGVCALGGFAHAARICFAIQIQATPEPNHWSDIHCYGGVPAAIYAFLGGAAGAIWIGAPGAANLVGFTLLALLLISIRNAWDLVTFLAPRQREG
jgi:hypothetical protein